MTRQKADSSYEHPLALSARIIDATVDIQPVNRITNKLSWLLDNLFIVESFSHVMGIVARGGLVVVDTSGVYTGRQVVEEIKRHVDAPFSAVIYTHGHVDHVGGSQFFKDPGGFSGPVFAHKKVSERLKRYQRMNDWNLLINKRQFGGAPSVSGFAIGGMDRFLPEGALWPDETYEDNARIEAAGEVLYLNHALGETDDHTWIYWEKEGVIFAGDLFIWLFPNAGNPQKVQRYPAQWAAALRKMLDLKPRLFVPSHGLPIEGEQRISRVVTDVATALEDLEEAVVAAMNAGKSLNEIVHEVKVPENLLKLPWLKPLYDDPEFVVHNLWRLYGGWWDLNPSHLKPPRDEELSKELAYLSGGARKLAQRALELLEENVRLAASLVEFAFKADPEDAEVASARASIYERFAELEPSLMAKGVFKDAAAQAARIAQSRT